MVKNNLNPVWNEQYEFDWHGEELVRVDCWDHNKAGDYQFIKVGVSYGSFFPSFLTCVYLSVIVKT